MAGPLWYNQRTGEVLKASRRYNNRGKTAGDLAASLQLNVWRRAEEPGKLIHELVGGGHNARGFTALENPLWFKHGPPHYVADHPDLRFLWQTGTRSHTSFMTSTEGDFSKDMHKVRIQYSKKCAQRVQ
jgi:hypothetical protein